MEAVTAEELGTAILDSLKKDAGELWDKLEDRAREQIEWASKRMGSLTIRKFKGEDVGRSMMGLEAIIANWSYVHASQAMRAFWSAVQSVVGLAGEFLGSVATGAIGRLKPA